MNFAQVLNFLRKRDTLILSVAAAALIFMLAASQMSESRYRSSGKVILYPPSNARPTEGTTTLDWRTDFTLLHTFMQSETFLTRVANRLGDPKITWAQVRSTTQISLLAGYPGQANILQIDVTASDATLAFKMDDAQVHELIDFVPTFSAEEFTRNADFLKNLMVAADDRLDKSETQMAEWQKRHQVLDVGAAANDYMTSLTKLQGKEDEAAQQVRSLEERVNQLHEYIKSGDSEVPPWLLLDQKNDHIPSLQQNLATERTKLAELKNTYKEGEPALTIQEARTEKLEAQLKSGVENYVQSLTTEREAQLAEAKGQLAAIQRSENRMKGTWALAQNNLEMSKMSRQITALEADYNSLRNQYESALIAEQNARREGSIKLLEEPTQGAAIPSLLGKDLKQVLPVIVPLSLLLGVLAAYGVDRASGGTISASIESTLGVPLLGSIPRLPQRVVEKWEELRQEIKVVSPPTPGQPALEASGAEVDTSR